MTPFSQELRVGSRSIGVDGVYIIAEMACAHDGEVDRAKRIIEAASEAGADAIQFEVLDPDDNIVPGRDGYFVIKRLYFPPETWKYLFDHARTLGLAIFSFAYDMNSLKLALQLGTDGIKLNSSDLLNVDMLRGCAESRLPFTLGTGGSTLDEVGEALSFVLDHGGRKVVLMQGVQNFPTKTEYARVHRMRILREAFGTLVGYADHTDAQTELSKVIDLAALGMGAVVLEKHITMDRSEKGVDHESALEPDEFTTYVKLIKEAEKALGPPRATGLIDADRRYRLFQKKSIVAARDLPEGRIIGREDVRFLRDMNEVGMPPTRVDEVIGKRTRCVIDMYRLIREEDLTVVN